MKYFVVCFTDITGETFIREFDTRSELEDFLLEEPAGYDVGYVIEGTSKDISEY